MTAATRTCRRCRRLQWCRHHKDGLVWWCNLQLRLPDDIELGPFRPKVEDDDVPLRNWTDVERMLGQSCVLYEDEAG